MPSVFTIATIPPGYDDESLVFQPKENAIIFTKIGYSSFLPEMNNFDEIHICGFDTDACVYKTAMDLIEIGVRPVDSGCKVT